MWDIPLSDLDYGEEEIDAVSRVLRSRWLTMGERVKDFEQLVCDTFGVKEAVMVSSGTTALHLALQTIDCSPVHEVIVPALSFVATANVVLYCGATPIFADIVSLDVPTISPESIEAHITEHTHAVIVMHYAGYECRMNEIREVIQDAEKKYGKKIYVIEDAAHAIGGKTADDEWLGSLGDIGCYSFFSNKNLATGEGGMLVTNHSEVAERARLLRSHALTRTTMEHHYLGQTDYDVIDAGYNYRPTEISAALGIVQFNKLLNNNKIRHEITVIYHTNMGDCAHVRLPFSAQLNYGLPACHILPVLFESPETVKAVRHSLHSKKIQTSHHYRPITDFTYYKQRFGDLAASLSLTYEYSSRELTLPLYPGLKPQDVSKICNAVKEVIETT